MSRIFAKTINCTNRTAAGEACNECDSCRQFNENRSLNIIELDAASNNGTTTSAPVTSRCPCPDGGTLACLSSTRCICSNAAFNSFLKTLEEPPGYVIFILPPPKNTRFIPTILSCAVVDLRLQPYINQRYGATICRTWQQAKASAPNPSAQCDSPQGRRRHARCLSIFDQVAASTQGNITYAATIENLQRLLEQLLQPPARCIRSPGHSPKRCWIYKEIRNPGIRLAIFVNGLCLVSSRPRRGAESRTLPLLKPPTRLGRRWPKCLEAAPDIPLQGRTLQRCRLQLPRREQQTVFSRARSLNCANY